MCMVVCKIPVTLLCILSSALLQSIHAQDAPDDYVAAHNRARAAVGVGPMSWDNNLAAFAENFVNELSGDCALVHSGGPYGENLAMSTGYLSAKAAVDLWVDEKEYYDYNSNTCALGKVCRHYTQVVWGDSVRVGCAKVRCRSGGTVIGCNYNPPGNFAGQTPYRARARPWVYEQGVSLVVKSFNKKRIQENIEIFDWELSSEELEKINEIPQTRGHPAFYCINPDEGPYKSLEEFWDGEI